MNKLMNNYLPGTDVCHIDKICIYEDLVEKILSYLYFHDIIQLMCSTDFKKLIIKNKLWQNNILFLSTSLYGAKTINIDFSKNYFINYSDLYKLISLIETHSKFHLIITNLKCITNKKLSYTKNNNVYSFQSLKDVDWQYEFEIEEHDETKKIILEVILKFDDMILFKKKININFKHNIEGEYYIKLDEIKLFWTIKKEESLNNLSYKIIFPRIKIPINALKDIIFNKRIKNHNILLYYAI